MPGHATAHAHVEHIQDGATVRVPMPGRPLQLLDARPPVHWTPEEVEQAIERQQKRAGALVALARERIEASWSAIRAELNQIAGGQASARVAVLAHHAMRAHAALELQTLLTEQAVGEESKGAEGNLRNQAGLSVVASDCLNKAYEVAREEGKTTKGSATDQLMGRLGIQQPGPASVPDLTPGTPSFGASPLNPAALSPIPTGPGPHGLASDDRAMPAPVGLSPNPTKGSE